MHNKLNNHQLKTVCEEVLEGEDVWPLIEGMKESMTRGQGIGLAANQVGSTKRVIMIYTQGFQQIFINPVITKKYGGKVTSKEGCLSFPGKTAIVVRSKQIIVEGFTPEWKPIKRKLKGLASYCVQHEVDHLDGITCFDIATKVR
jgi:peptide deformylase